MGSASPRLSFVGAALAAWRAPGRALQSEKAGGADETRALIFLMIACLMGLIAGLPELSRQPLVADEDIGLVGLLAGRTLGAIFFAPLFLYAAAAILHLVRWIAGHRGPFLGTRIVLFYALFAASPFALLAGIISAVAPALAAFANLAAFGGFLLLLVAMMRADGKAESTCAA